MEKQFIGKFCMIIIFFMVCGCGTQSEITIEEKVVEKVVEKPIKVEVIDTRMPLTISVWDRLSRSMENVSSDVKRFQLILSGRITLEREYTAENDSSEDGGRAKFEDVHTRDVITISDQLEGQTLEYKEIDGEIILYVCFEKDNDYTLPFSCKKDDENRYFHLKCESGNIPLQGEEKGIIEYGGQEYKVKYSGTPPNLFIKLSQNDRDKINNRILEGRKIE
jgi:hypothetical protein